MSKTFTYKGYTGITEIDLKLNEICGHVIGIKDVITFNGTTPDEAYNAFKDSVDDYLEWCEELGEEPDKPFSGKLPYRTSPENHRKIYHAANILGKSINAWMDEILVEKAEEVIQS